MNIMKQYNRKLESWTFAQSRAKTGTDIAASLNNMDVSSEYILWFKHEIEEKCAELNGIFSIRTFHFYIFDNEIR